jgi:tetratricopeptide (TPR) repeat protein
MTNPNQQSQVARKSLLEDAIAAARRGERAKAREQLTRVLRYDQKNEEAWLWMSSVVESDRERIFCLNSVLKLNPNNKTAKRGLALLGALPPEMRADLGIEVIGVTVDAPSAGEAKQKRRGGFTIRRNRALENVLIILLAVITFAVIGVIVYLRVIAPRFAAPVATAAPLAVTDAATELAAPRTPTLAPTPTIPALNITVTPGAALTPLAEILKLQFTPTPTVFAPQFFPEDDYRLGESAFKAGDLDKATDSFQKAATQNPRNYSAHYYLGLIYLQRRDYNRAFTSFGNAVKINTDYAPAYIGRGQAQFGLGGNPLSDFDKANQLDVKWGEPYIQKSIYYMSVRGRDAAGAVSELEKGKRAVPGNVVLQAYLVEAYILANRLTDARTTLDAAFKLDATVLDLYRANGRLALANLDYKAAQTALNTYTVYRSDDGVGWMLFGQADLGAGELAAAVTKLSRAIELKPDDPRDAYVALGEVNLIQGNATLAKENFTKALSLGASASVRVKIGQAYYRKGEYDNAIKELKSAVEGAPNQFDPNYWLGAAYIGAKNYKDALPPLSAAVTRATTDLQKFDALTQRAIAYNATNDKPKARTDLNEALLLNVAGRETERVEALKLLLTELAGSPPGATYTPKP